MSFPEFHTQQLAPQEISSSLGESAEIQGPECVLCLYCEALHCVHCRKERAPTVLISWGCAYVEL